MTHLFQYPTPGLIKVAEERDAHYSREGFDNSHDDLHLNGELEQYALYLLTGNIIHFPEGWHKKWLHRHDEGNHEKNIVKAASLLIAELDRRARSKRYFTEPQ